MWILSILGNIPSILFNRSDVLNEKKMRPLLRTLL